MIIQCSACKSKQISLTLGHVTTIGGTTYHPYRCECGNVFYASGRPAKNIKEPKIYLLEDLKPGTVVHFGSPEKWKGVVIDAETSPHEGPNHSGIRNGKAIWIESINDYAYGILDYPIVRIVKPKKQ